MQKGLIDKQGADYFARKIVEIAREYERKERLTIRKEIIYKEEQENTRLRQRIFQGFLKIADGIFDFIFGIFARFGKAFDNIAAVFVIIAAYVGATMAFLIVNYHLCAFVTSVDRFTCRAATSKNYPELQEWLSSIIHPFMYGWYELFVPPEICSVLLKYKA